VRISPDQLAEHRGWKQLLCAGAVLLILLARVPYYWSGGEFVGEDGWIYFADAWNHSLLESLTLSYAGYFHLLARLVAALWSGLPVIWQPYAYAATGLALNAGILSAFYLPAFRQVMPTDLGRLVVVFFLALAPNAENLGLLLGLHWYLAFGLTLILIAPAPVNPGARVAILSLVLLCVWSSPSALMLAPFAFIAWMRSRNSSERLHFTLICGLLLVVGLLIALMRVKYAERTGAFAWADTAVSVDRLVLRGWLGVGLLGPQLAGYFAREIPRVLDFFTFGVFTALLALLWKNRSREFARHASLVLGAALLMLLLSLTRTAYVAELARLALPRHVRYLTAPTLLLYVGLGIVVCGAWPDFPRRYFALPMGLVAALLIFALPGEIHWSRPTVWFHLRDAIPAIEQLKAQYAKDGQPASLYIPTDIPYWGPVLEVGGGRIMPPEAGLAKAIGATPDTKGQFNSWLGRFTAAGPGNWVEHQVWGRLEFTGVEKGRVFFHDSAGRLLFTSPLLYPRLWMLDGFQWTFFQPPQP